MYNVVDAGEPLNFPSIRKLVVHVCEDRAYFIIEFGIQSLHHCVKEIQRQTLEATPCNVVKILRVVIELI